MLAVPCNIKKKKADMAKKQEMDKTLGSAANDKSFKNRRGVSSYAKRNSVLNVNANNSVDAVDDHFRQLAAEHGQQSPSSAARRSSSRGKNNLQATPESALMPQPSVSPQKIVTKVVHKADPKVHEVMKK